MKLNKDRLVELDIPFAVFAILFILDTLIIENDTFHSWAMPFGIGALVIACFSAYMRWWDRNHSKAKGDD